MNYFKNTVSTALGPDLPVLVELVPLLEKLFPVDEYPRPNIEVSPAEAEERTLRLIQRFLSCVAFDDRSLVLFVDDLQWCSASEASVISGLIASFRPTMSSPAVRNCILIITYRVNEVPEATLQKITESIDKVKRRGPASDIRGAVELQVGPLRLVSPFACQLTDLPGRARKVVERGVKHTR